MKRVIFTFVITLAVCMGLMAATSSSASTQSTQSEASSQAALTQPSFSYVGCELTFAGSKTVRNGSGHVVVQAGSKKVYVIKTINGKKASTNAVAAGKTRIFDFTTKNKSSKNSYQLFDRVPVKGGGYSYSALSGPLEIGKGMCIK